MKAAITDGKEQIWLDEAPVPEPGQYQCLCKILACATCTGTDQKHIENKLPWKQDYPGILGHESVGRVMKIGDKVKNIKKGDIFLHPTAVYPGEKLGDYYSLWGGFAEYGLITDTKTFYEDNPEGILNNHTKFQQKIPEDISISPADATMLITLKETAGFAMSLKITMNTSLTILGAGSVAMSMCFFAKLIGAFPIIVVARRDEPLNRMKKFGANFTVNNKRENMVKKVKEITGGKGVDYVIDTAGDEKLLIESLNLLAENGKIAPYATFATNNPTQNLDQSKITQGVTGEVQAHNYMLDLVKIDLLKLENFYSHRMSFDKIAEGFELLKNKKAFKIVFEMGD